MNDILNRVQLLTSSSLPQRQVFLRTMGYHKTHEIVASADTIVLLRNPCTAFAEWIQPVPSDIPDVMKAASGSPASTSSSGRVQKKLKLSKAATPEPVVDDDHLESAVVLPADNDGSFPAAVPLSLFGIESSEIEQAATTSGTLKPVPRDGISKDGMIDTHATGAEPQPVVEPEENEGIHFQVCTGNLMSGSPWFNRALKNDGWMESVFDSEDGRRHISLLTTGTRRHS